MKKQKSTENIKVSDDAINNQIIDLYNQYELAKDALEDFKEGNIENSIILTLNNQPQLENEVVSLIQAIQFEKQKKGDNSPFKDSPPRIARDAKKKKLKEKIKKLVRGEISKAKASKKK